MIVKVSIWMGLVVSAMMLVGCGSVLVVVDIL